jgi:hypothetical protein
MLNVAIKLPISFDELSILISPLPHSMQGGDTEMLGIDVDTLVVTRLPPVNIIAEVQRSLDAWRTRFPAEITIS